MDHGQEKDQFDRIRIVAKIERAEGIIATYWEHMGIYRDNINIYHKLLGHIGERLGEPAPKEPA